MSIAKTGLTVAALGATGYSRLLGRKVAQDTSVAAASGTESTVDTPIDVVRAQKKLNALQWVIPALTGVLVVVSAFAGEQQRPSNVKKGVLSRVFTR
jgi:hypothetical protein